MVLGGFYCFGCAAGDFWLCGLLFSIVFAYRCVGVVLGLLGFFICLFVLFFFFGVCFDLFGLVVADVVVYDLVATFELLVLWCACSGLAFTLGCVWVLAF